MRRGTKLYLQSRSLPQMVASVGFYVSADKAGWREAVELARRDRISCLLPLVLSY
jgi:hypothetical protein